MCSVIPTICEVDVSMKSDNRELGMGTWKDNSLRFSWPAIDRLPDSSGGQGSGQQSSIYCFSPTTLPARRVK